ncbi:hypothetical protein J5N97_026537 [Dioscorea zingiberensis]|uniref:Transmembrane protein n=1 Tax=Dioscorea zingiberensis TaxID=325984 RepID=A0A9D5C3I6_9LILI|nr:hypothetical protein J5N97_026537 [Dioscorea zingiberensis]
MRSCSSVPSWTFLSNEANMTMLAILVACSCAIEEEGGWRVCGWEGLVFILGASGVANYGGSGVWIRLGGRCGAYIGDVFTQMLLRLCKKYFSVSLFNIGLMLFLAALIMTVLFCPSLSKLCR